MNSLLDKLRSRKKRQEKVYIFLDESGKPEVYSAKGVNLVTEGKATKFLVLVGVRTHDQLALQQQIMDFRLQLLRDPALVQKFSTAYTLDAFHANRDYDEVMELFYRFITTLDIKLDIIVVDKLKCFESLQRNPGRLYGIMAGQLIKNLCHQAEKTEVIFSRKDSKLHLRQELEREVERVRLDYIQKHPKLDTDMRIAYNHNPHYSHGALQIADYVAYAVFQVYEFDDRKWYDMVKSKIGRVQDICNKKYYTRSNPL